MALVERVPEDELYLGLVINDPLLIMLQFWGGDLTMADGSMNISFEQRSFMCDQSDRILLCTGRKVAKTLTLERDIVQAGLTWEKIGTLDEAMFFAPAEAHLNPVRDRVFSTIVREPIFSEMIERNQHGFPMMSKGDGFLQWKTGLKWHFRIEGTTGTDVNMVGLRCRMIEGDEMAFGSTACHKSRVNTALPGCKWKYCGVPNGVRGTVFWSLDQTDQGVSWSRHKYPQFANPIYDPEIERRKLIEDHGGELSHSYITQVLGQWGDEVVSSFPPGTISTYSDRPNFYHEWGAKNGGDLRYRADALDAAAKVLDANARWVIGWDYGVSPDPTIISMFCEEEVGDWYLRVRIKLRGVTFPHQISFIRQIADRFNMLMVCTDEASAVSQLASETGWSVYSEETKTGNIMWANSNGRIDLLDDDGVPVLDEVGKPMKEIRKKWATDELRISMVHAKEGTPHAHRIWLPEKDTEIADELIGTTERRTQGGYVQYLVAKRTEGSKSADDHTTDSLRYAMLAIYATLEGKFKGVDWSEYAKVLGWVGTNAEWRAPWDTT